MDKRIEDCINDRPGSYILPFLWLHGEPREKLLSEIDAIEKSGIREFCLESRTYEAFCRDPWWEDFAFLLQEAKRRGLYVWLLDDKHFPTGYANGAIGEKYPALKKKNVRIAALDVAGPIKGAAFLAGRFDPDKETLVSVSAFRRTGYEEQADGATGVLLTDRISDGLVFWDVPEGVWRIYFIIKTRNGPPAFAEYIDMCSPESCKVMLSEIYEPHYERFGAYFGNTFRGFFSDEPCFANNISSYDDKLGTPGLILPWKTDMIGLLARKTGLTEQETEVALPALWYDITGRSAQMRYAYMELLSCLYRDHFSNLLGNWCREHGVMYIGHVIEDMNTHMRLGYGSAHYFRALEGQDMAGMDIVLHQILPGITNMKHQFSCCAPASDPKFFLNTVAKLCSSAAHLDPKKKNRAMCELYGAYGWAEGLPLMKYLTDCMLAGGVNHFVPHAFTPRENDPDCPPHFYANGTNPQFPLFRYLMLYLQRACHILSSGTHRANAAVFYNAEGEWCGGANRLFQDIATNLAERQIDYDFIPEDLLLSGAASIKDGKLAIGGESYDALVVSYSEVFPRKLLEAFRSFAALGLPVVFTDAAPDRTEACWNTEEALEEIRNETRTLCSAFRIVPASEIAAYFTANGFTDALLDGEYPDVRVFHTAGEGNDKYFFFHLNMQSGVDTYVKLPGSADHYVEYDLWENALYRLRRCEKGVRLVLPPGNSVLIIAGNGLPQDLPERKYLIPDKRLANLNFKVSLKESDTFRYYCDLDCASGLRNLARELPYFCGAIRYEGICSSRESVRRIDLGSVGETAQLWINGIYCGARIQAPYVFDVSSAWKKGENEVIIEIISNLAYKHRDYFSTYLPLPPTGLLGPVLYA